MNEDDDIRNQEKGTQPPSQDNGGSVDDEQEKLQGLENEDDFGGGSSHGLSDDQRADADKDVDRLMGYYDKGEDGKKDESNDDYDEDETGKWPGLYNPDKKKKSEVFGVKVDKKKALIGGGAFGGGIAAVVITFFLLLPLKIVNTVQNAQRHFFSSAESAIDQRADTVFSGYFKKKVLPGLDSNGNCSSTRINRHCTKVGAGTNPVSRLYRTWSDNNFEGKLAEKYGLEFTKKGGNYYVTAPDLKGGVDLGDGKTGVDLGTDSSPDGFLKSNKNLFSYLDGVAPSSTKSVRKAASAGIEGELFFKQVVYRFKMGRLLERKYGIKRCIVACDPRDDFADWKTNKSKAYQITMVQRVIAPRSEKLGLVMQCLLIGGCNDPAGKGTEGEKQTKLEKEVNEALARYAEKLGKEALEDVIKESSDILDKGAERYVLDKVLTQVFSKGIAQTADKAIPIIGWVDMADTVVTQLADAGPTFRRATWLIGAGLAVNHFMSYRSHADEILAGNSDEALTGSFANSLGATGLGSAPAEASPLYPEIVGGGETSGQTAFSALFPSAYAAEESKSSAYICNDEKPVSGDICPEDSLDSPSKVQSALDDISSVFSVFSNVFTVWHSDIFGVSLKGIFQGVTGWVGGLTNSALNTIPGVSQAKKGLENEAAEQLGKIQEVVADKMIVSALPDSVDDISGAKNFTVLASGADVAANDWAHYGLGGQVLTDEEVATIRDEQNNKLLEEFQDKPLFARMFDTHDSMSMISRVALSMPAPNTASARITGTLTNPLNSILSSFGSLFGGKASAAPKADAFGVRQYGFKPGSALLDSDPEALSDADCTEQETDYNDSATEDPANGMPYNDTASICKLDETVMAGLGGMYDESLIGSDVGGDSTVSSGSTGGTGGDSGINSPKLNGYTIPCTGLPSQAQSTGTRDDTVNWEGIPDSGVLGNTYGNKPIKVYIRNACTTSNVKTIVVTSSIHASENWGQPISFQLLFKKDLPDNLRIIAIPELNGDGLPAGAVGRVNGNAVNLNRNFDYRWSEMSGEDVARGSTNYRGASPASEPETQAMVAFLQSIGDISLLAVYHDNLNYVGSSGATSTNVARVYHDYLSAHNIGMGLGNAGGINIYQKGSLDGWFNQATGKPSMLVEMPGSATGTQIETHADALINLITTGTI